MIPDSLPILSHKLYAAPTVFTPENLLREARRQKSIREGSVPAVCVLDPDGDIVQHLVNTGQARPNAHWACYHTKLYDFSHAGIKYGMGAFHLS
ncbi:MAG TPA: hypothetical protein VIK33_16715 [Anaerolineae bacterium]